MADSSADLYDEQYYRHYCGEFPTSAATAGSVLRRCRRSHRADDRPGLGARRRLRAWPARRKLARSRRRGVRGRHLRVCDRKGPARHPAVLLARVDRRSVAAQATTSSSRSRCSSIFRGRPRRRRSPTSASSPTTSCSRRRRSTTARPRTSTCSRRSTGPTCSCATASCATSTATPRSSRRGRPAFRRQSVTLHRVVHDYERRFWPVWKENADLRSLVNELRGHSTPSERKNDALRRGGGVTEEDGGSAVADRAQPIVAHGEDDCAAAGARGAEEQPRRPHPRGDAGDGRARTGACQAGGVGPARGDPGRILGRLSRAPKRTFPVAPVTAAAPLAAHRGASVDVIVCVHNALDDVRRCLERWCATRGRRIG